MLRHRHGKENQPPLNNGQTNSDATEPTTLEKRLKQKRKYFNRTYQEMSQEKKQALLLKNRAKKQQRTGQSSNSPIQSAIATSSILSNSETSLPMTNNRSSYEATGPSRNQASASTPLSVRFDGASVIDPNRASGSSHGVQTCRKRVYSRAKNQPPVLIQQNNSTKEFDNITEGICL